MTRLEELQTFKNTEQRGTVAVAFCSLIASLAVAGALKAPNDTGKALAAGAGFTAGIVGLIVGREAEEARLKLQDWKDVSDSAFTTNLAHEMSPKMFQQGNPNSVVALDPAIDFFNWTELKDKRDEYPHLLLLGKTGAGKSILAERLCDLLGGNVIAVAPHYKRGDYQSASLIVGLGRNVGESMLPYSDEPEKGKSQDTDLELEFVDIVSGRVKANAAQFLNALLREMNRRYQLVNPETGMPDDDGIYTSEYENSGVFNIILDETPVLAKLPGWRDVFSKLIREARKVGLRLVVLTQGKEVKALGIEGEGSIRESLTFIWLTPFVEDEAERILGTKKTDEGKAYWTKVIRLLRENKYSCLVEDKFTLTPVTQQWLNARNNIAPRKQQEVVSDTSVSVPENRPTSEALETGSYPQAPSININVSNENNSSAVAQTSSTGDERKLRESLWRIARKGAEEGFNRSSVVKKRLDYEGRRYNDGLKLLDSLEAEFGRIAFK